MKAESPLHSYLRETVTGTREKEPGAKAAREIKPKRGKGTQTHSELETTDLDEQLFKKRRFT